MQTRGIEKPLQSCYEPPFLSSKLTNNACFQTFRKELSNQKLDPRDRDNWCFFGEILSTLLAENKLQFPNLGDIFGRLKHKGKGKHSLEN